MTEYSLWQQLASPPAYSLHIRAGAGQDHDDKQAAPHPQRHRELRGLPFFLAARTAPILTLVLACCARQRRKAGRKANLTRKRQAIDAAAKPKRAKMAPK